ncbi:MAG: hypothetical protein R3185_05980, partial [Candidatus Thermoplasmatota archaeon]|nr:hypothetical protein [Candidatus Thermoplasmatota archaeon]
METKPNRAWFMAILAALLVAGCTGTGGSSGPFVNVADEAGISYTVDHGLPPNVHPMAFLGGGLAVGDVNGDDWPDF